HAVAEVDVAGEGAGQDHVVVAGNRDPLGPLRVLAAVHLAPQVIAVAVELGDDDVARSRRLEWTAAEVGVTIYPTDEDQVVVGVDHDLGGELIAAIAKALAPQRVAVAIVLGDHDVGLVAAGDQRLAAEADHALEVAGAVDV